MVFPVTFREAGSHLRTLALLYPRQPGATVEHLLVVRSDLASLLFSLPLLQTLPLIFLSSLSVFFSLPSFLLLSPCSLLLLTGALSTGERLKISASLFLPGADGSFAYPQIYL